MKAVVIGAHGGPETVTVEQIGPPKAASHEVLLEVRAASLNHLDLWVRMGRGGLELPMPHVLGSDASGVVAAAGPGARGLSVGDEVVLYPGLCCGRCEFCRAGEHSLCESFGIVGLSRPGTFAEYVAVPARCVYPKPAHMTFEQAAALPLVYLTAWRMLMSRGDLQAGQTVLIHGIGGGVALSSLQLAKLAGAKVVVTSSSDDKLARAEQMGADHIVNYAACGDLAQRVREITAGRGVDLVVDTVGAATWPIDFSVVCRGGKIVLCGVTTGATAETDLRALYWNQVTVMGSTMGSEGEFSRMLSAVNAAKLTPVVDRMVPLDEAPAAMERMEKGEQFGKIVLRVGEPTR